MLLMCLCSAFDNASFSTIVFVSGSLWVNKEAFSALFHAAHFPLCYHLVESLLRPMKQAKHIHFVFLSCSFLLFGILSIAYFILLFPNIVNIRIRPMFTFIFFFSFISSGNNKNISYQKKNRTQNKKKYFQNAIVFVSFSYAPMQIHKFNTISNIQYASVEARAELFMFNLFSFERCSHKLLCIIGFKLLPESNLWAKLTAAFEKLSE